MQLANTTVTCWIQRLYKFCNCMCTLNLCGLWFLPSAFIVATWHIISVRGFLQSSTRPQKVPPGHYRGLHGTSKGHTAPFGLWLPPWENVNKPINCNNSPELLIIHNHYHPPPPNYFLPLNLLGSPYRQKITLNVFKMYYIIKIL